MPKQSSDVSLYRICSNSGYVGHMDTTWRVWVKNEYLSRVDRRDGRVYNNNDQEIGLISDKGAIIKNGNVVGLIDPYREVWSNGTKIGRAFGHEIDLKLAGGAALLLLLP